MAQTSAADTGSAMEPEPRHNQVHPLYFTPASNAWRHPPVPLHLRFPQCILSLMHHISTAHPNSSSPSHRPNPPALFPRLHSLHPPSPPHILSLTSPLHVSPSHDGMHHALCPGSATTALCGYRRCVFSSCIIHLELKPSSRQQVSNLVQTSPRPDLFLDVLVAFTPLTTGHDVPLSPHVTPRLPTCAMRPW